MHPFLRLVLGLLLPSVIQATDLAAVYKRDILLLRDADKMAAGSPLTAEELTLSLPRQLSYPVGLTQDLSTRRLFVAEAVPQMGKIFTLALNPNLNVESMSTAVKSLHYTPIEGLSFDPRSQELYWTDAEINGIFKASVPASADGSPSRPQRVHRFSDVNEPRGVAIDYCKDRLYWSERGASTTFSSLEMCALDGSEHQVVEQDQGHNLYYQGLTYDHKSGSLLWASTVGDKYANSSCSIFRTSLGSQQHQKLLQLDNCYPFDLTIDEDFLYWADWSREGIMRVSLTDLDNVEKILHTPPAHSSYGSHNGVYGLAIVSRGLPDAQRVLCEEGTNVREQVGVDTSSDSRSDNGATSVTSPKQQGNQDKVVEQQVAADASSSSISDTGEQHIVSLPTTGEHQTSSDSNPAKPASLQQMNDAAIVMKDPDTTMEAKDDSKGIKIAPAVVVHVDSEAGESMATPAREQADVDEVTVTLHSKTHEEDMTASVNEYLTDTTQKAHTIHCDSSQLYFIIMGLAILSTLLFCITGLLSVKLYCLTTQRTTTKDVLPIIADSSEAKCAPLPRQVKRFGPKRRYGSGTKSNFNGPSPCSGLSDGVTINIEDCCQMTQCDTPCYTSIKREGRGYKALTRQSKGDDGVGLLDDADNL